jgi:hypothetical protein
MILISIYSKQNREIGRSPTQCYLVNSLSRCYLKQYFSTFRIIFGTYLINSYKRKKLL